jgi:prepilin-type N-terminal cleavage/methylation domain-containing protein
MNKKGFTLIELLVVIAIIGILASVVLASLNTARRKARDAQRISDIKQIKLALEFYYDDNPSTGYPADGVVALTAALVPNYIPQMPTAPAGATPGYSYNQLSTTDYCIGVNMEDGNATPGDDSNCVADAAVACGGGTAWVTDLSCYSTGP